MENFKAYLDKKRFRYIIDCLLKDDKIIYSGPEKIKKTACLYGNKINIYIDTSDGVNDDLKIQEYCGRIKRIVSDSQGKPFLFFKSAHSNAWSNNIRIICEENNGKLIPFFKWPFSDNFYNYLYNRRQSINDKYNDVEKTYDIGVFFAEKVYDYPRPSEHDNLISWSDHKTFSIPGTSKNTGVYANNSRKKLIEKLNNSQFKVLHTNADYKEYIKASYSCKVIINPPGIGEYTSRMVDMSYLGNCIVLRKNSYDNGYSWKKHIPEIDFEKDDWEIQLKNVIDHFETHQKKCKNYFNECWTPEAIVCYLMEKINEFS